MPVTNVIAAFPANGRSVDRHSSISTPRPPGTGIETVPVHATELAEPRRTVWRRFTELMTVLNQYLTRTEPVFPIIFHPPLSRPAGRKAPTLVEGTPS